MELDRAVCDRAVRSRDARFDGRFFTAVTTTRIYCRPVCPAPLPKAENVRYFASAAAASAAGFRPCLRCRPEAAPGTPAWAGTCAVVSRALRLIDAGGLDEGRGLDAFAEGLGVTARHLRRLFLRHLGATPVQVACTRRVHLAKRLIDETDLPFTDVAFSSGFGSLRGFNRGIRRTYGRAPTGLRRSARSTISTDPARGYSFRLAYRPPYDWDAVLGFLRSRAIPGVEEVDGSGYRRTLTLDGVAGRIGVRHAVNARALELDVHFPDPRSLLRIVARVRGMFDLGADPAVIRAHLGRDVLLAAPLRRHAGIRTPGAWDGFELAVRAIVGQQVSVAAASTIAGRLAALFGTAWGSERLFPTAEQLAGAEVETAGIVRSRAAAIRQLARAVADGAIRFGPGAEPRESQSLIRAIPGVGDWTAQYVAMRAWGDPDALPGGDLVLRRATGARTASELERRAEPWRPWRSYAAILLWQDAVDRANGGQRSPRRGEGRVPGDLPSAR